MSMSRKNKNLTLPLELVENSIDFLYADPKTLRSACLVSRAWVPICRAYIFRRIILHWCDDGARRSNSLYALLLKTPSLANYIRELSVHEGLISSEYSQITFCFAQSQSLPKLLHRLPRLRLFEFRASALTHWCELGAELDYAVLQIAKCPTLDELILGSWNFSSQPKALDAMLEAATKNVKALALTDIVTSVVPEDYSITTIQAPAARVPSAREHHRSQSLAVKSLSVDDGEASFVPFCARWLHGRPSAIRSLHLSCSTNQSSISNLLWVIGESLEHFELDIRALHGDGYLDLRRNTRLQSLHIQASEHPLMSVGSNRSIPWIVDVLSTLCSFEHLELLVISFGVNADRLRRLSQTDWDYWCRLDQILSQRRYSRLCTVKIGIKFHCHNGSGYIEEARRIMSGLLDAGILDIYTETRQYCCMDYY
ncbi:hypothetical protein P691DRAFT_802814 [Macrolepiota fuliginosa MF-IS2]|uniref:F-box domain-containing protein n=1 Tax=Macrolepiota fuliginosa MF-IS2 TaxID=1400762 RepID=A0A9P5XLB3_9AGAR|nr:hypothetical protein P691DRAFT_802814 [Macrolepiota fuliginosa MF-IS2]